MARKFYAHDLKLREIAGDHPRGALWFEIGNIELHVREENNHQADTDQHPAFEVDDLDAAEHYLKGQQIRASYSTDINGRQRCFFRDPWGNRFELIQYH